MVPHLLLGLAAQKLVDHFEDMLELAGAVHGKARAEQREEHHDDGRHQDLHGDEVGPRARLGMQPEKAQYGVAQAGEVVVKQLCEPKLSFVHTAIRR